jgi:hypothetical protein
MPRSYRAICRPLSQHGAELSTGDHPGGEGLFPFARVRCFFFSGGLGGHGRWKWAGCGYGTRPPAGSGRIGAATWEPNDVSLTRICPSPSSRAPNSIVDGLRIVEDERPTGCEAREKPRWNMVDGGRCGCRPRSAGRRRLATTCCAYSSGTGGRGECGCSEESFFFSTSLN